MNERLPQPGDIGLTKIGGLLGWIISIGQAFVTSGGSRWSHVFVMVDDHCLIAAQPGGAKYDSIKNYKHQAVILDIPLTEEQRQSIVTFVSSLEGVKYGFSGYLYIVLASFGIKPKWLVRHVRSNGRYICSQLADKAYNVAGVKLFDDEREPFSVIPADLDDLLYAKFEVK